ncbi:N-acyl-D-amino-acid deacylase family protein [Nesterenkonia xinjiangensis]|uniref:Dihydroorotase/N-acyl-D-amino-acid deacylase n=1 Tax=Nesterenkonia xinjiangensis TaxID=225327 RepID=A0A7Z0GN27_9MICC|nr:amidohydrolase family protein [Nesterenkonia xinjiangensis]NYJ78743.1 dihydroorotase/N-acyl-D-amino-acid deacylase [Nesterenkonia xinjiangensis]
MMHDRQLIRGGDLLDGTGRRRRRADVRIVGGRVEEVGADLPSVEGETLLDAAGRLLLPAFVDVHSHDDAALFRPRALDPKLSQGVTTTIVGNCGHGCAPSVAGGGLEDYATPVLGPFPEEVFPRFTDYLDAVERSAPALDVIALVPHAPLRAGVMGMEQKPADAAQLREMAAHLDEALSAGAVGLSLGLMYAPGSAAEREELLALAQVVARRDKVLVAHIRNEGGRLESSLDEFLALGRDAGCALHVSHLKVTGAANFGTMPQIIDRLEAARAEGIDVTADVYPYTAGSTTASTLFPSWTTRRGTDSLLQVLTDPDARARALDEVRRPWDGPLENQFTSVGPDAILLAGFSHPETRAFDGRALVDIAAERGQDPAEALADLVLSEDGVLTIIVHHSDPQGMREVLCWPHAFLGSDGLPREEGYVHPRLFGTFPRALSTYAWQDGLLPAEAVVRRMSSAPRARFGVPGGSIVPGAPADLQIIDPSTYTDRADYQNPRRETHGLDAVLLGGRPVWPRPPGTPDAPGSGSGQLHRTGPVATSLPSGRTTGQ